MNIDVKKLLASYYTGHCAFGDLRADFVENCEGQRRYVLKYFDIIFRDNFLTQEEYQETEAKLHEACTSIYYDLLSSLFDVYVKDEIFSPKLSETVHKTVVDYIENSIAGDALSISYAEVTKAYITHVGNIRTFCSYMSSDKTFSHEHLIL